MSKTVGGNLQLIMHPLNIDVSSLSLYLVWSRPVCRWTPNVTAGMYLEIVDDVKRYAALVVTLALVNENSASVHRPVIVGGRCSAIDNETVDVADINGHVMITVHNYGAAFHSYAYIVVIFYCIFN